VQGVGFRPFVFRLAQAHGLAGWVRNLSGEVEIHAQGAPLELTHFGTALIAEAPPLAQPVIARQEHATVQALAGFAILASSASARMQAHLPPDAFVCDDCLRELADPRDRRYRYPFINCTQCGPRYTLITRLPYDRAHTAMAGFPLCPACRAEYENPGDRRFHAEPLACPVCGPQLQFYSDAAGTIDDTARALDACVAALRAGLIVAVKGVGGYHLLCDARHDTAIARLRRLKPRPHKPLAVMFPFAGEDGLELVRSAAMVHRDSAKLLLDAARPIVLLEKRTPSAFHAARTDLNEAGVSCRTARCMFCPRMTSAALVATGKHQRRTGAHRQSRSRVTPRGSRRCLPASRPPDRASGGRQRTARLHAARGHCASDVAWHR
jgi:hydrogenase maturation protein HypF